MARDRRSPNTMPATAVGSNPGAFGSAEWGLLTASAIIWGSSFLFMEIGLESFRPGVITMARVALGTMALAFLPRARAAVDKEHRLRIFVLGIIWIGIPLSLFPIAQLWIDSSVAGMLNAAMPIFSALWAAYLLRVLPGWRQVVGIGVGFVGVVAISIPEVAASRANALGVGLVLIAVILYGLSTNLAVPLQQRYGAIPVLFRAQLAALVVVVPYGIAHLDGSTWAWNSALAMIPLGVLSTGLAFILMANLIGRVGASRASLVVYFVPIVAIALGVAFLNESLSPSAIAGTGLVLVGAWIASRKER